MSALDRPTSRSLSLSPTAVRRVSRGLSQLDGQAVLEHARIEQLAELQAAKVEAAAQVGGRAMQAVAVVTQLEQQLAQTVPLATSRLQAIGDIVSLAATEIVIDTTWKLRRC